ncbi:hypothetical protein AURDEDRAFT_123542 [Auricularia subglabra TFB-10046 SS5]|nr:hypothetical protein AURDEDRAFT_123542 [Auricularia subglabra TFB-10046 SS5]
MGLATAVCALFLAVILLSLRLYCTRREYQRRKMFNDLHFEAMTAPQFAMVPMPAVTPTPSQLGTAIDPPTSKISPTRSSVGSFDSICTTAARFPEPLTSTAPPLPSTSSVDTRGHVPSLHSDIMFMTPSSGLQVESSSVQSFRTPSIIPGMLELPTSRTSSCLNLHQPHSPTTSHSPSVTIPRSPPSSPPPYPPPSPPPYPPRSPPRALSPAMPRSPSAAILRSLPSSPPRSPPASLPASSLRALSHTPTSPHSLAAPRSPSRSSSCSLSRAPSTSSLDVPARGSLDTMPGGLCWGHARTSGESTRDTPALSSTCPEEHTAPAGVEEPMVHAALDTPLDAPLDAALDALNEATLDVPSNAPNDARGNEVGYGPTVHDKDAPTDAPHHALIDAPHRVLIDAPTVAPTIATTIATPDALTDATLDEKTVPEDAKDPHLPRTQIPMVTDERLWRPWTSGDSIKACHFKLEQEHTGL